MQTANVDKQKPYGLPHPVLIKVDPTKPAAEQAGIMNRWHPDIPAVASVRQGEVFTMECHEWTGGQIKNTDDADDVANVDLSQIHYLSGPIAVEEAEPGDALLVEILDVQPFAHQPWGFTGVFELENGGGLFAQDFKTKAAKAIWDFEGVYASSRHIPGVRFAGVTHPGLIGTAPSHELLALWNKREGDLIAKNVGCCPPVALAPEPKGAYVGQDLPADVRAKIYAEGARTVPGREHGGNCDIKNLSRGSKAYFPVFIKGANLSLGDLHFSQGDGELSFCGAIEMAGSITLKCSVIKDGIKKFALKQPIYIPSPVDPLYASQLVFQGLSVDNHGDGKQYSMDATIAYKEAARNTMAYLKLLGYTREQAHLLLSAAPVESHVAALVDSPNACITMGLPTAIFDRDIMPHPDGIEKRDYGQAAIRSDGARGFDPAT